MGPEAMADLADGDQGRQGVADHRQAQPLEPLRRTDGQLRREAEAPVSRRPTSDPTAPARVQAVRIGAEKVRSFP